jgi:crossover junction endodeoxyribonuclease RuvC
MKKLIIGIDPGLKGAIGVLCSDGSYGVYDIPVMSVEKSNKKIKNMIDLIALNKLVCAIVDSNIDRQIEAWVELVNAMPGQGVTSMFSMGRGLGNIEMVLTCYQIPINWVSPQKWKKEVIFGAGSDKLISVDKAKELFPLCELETKRGRKLDGRAEAMLIAEYGRRQTKT